jgi:hypothetical protein
MRKVSVFITGILLGSLVIAQTSKIKNYQNVGIIAKHNPYEKVLKTESLQNLNYGPATQTQFMNQHANKTSAISVVELGGSGNAYTNVAPEVNLLSTVPGQNWVTFFHRHNHVDYGGHNGQFRVDVSLDGGQTWEVDNDGNDAFNEPLAPYGRIPNATLYNPPGNTDICNAKLIWVSAGHKTANASPAWGYFVGGTAHKINSSCSNSYSGDYQPFELGTILYNLGLSRGGDKEFWTVGPKFDRSTQKTQGKYYIWRGAYNDNTGSTSWYIYDSVSFNPLQAADGSYQMGTPNMAFSPNGQYGWIIASGMPNGPAPYKHQLYYWKSNDFGFTWTPGMIDIANNQKLIDSLTTIFYTDETMTTLDTIIGKPFPIDYDLVVDWRGNAHIVCTFFNMYQGALNNLDSLGYLSPGLAKSIWDITTTDFGSTWDFTYIRELNTFRGASGDLRWTAGCQASNTHTGDAFVYAWVDDTSANATDQMQPDLWTFHYDMNTGANAVIPTNIKDWTSDDPTWNGKIILPSMSPFMYYSGMGVNGPVYKAPTAFCQILTDATSPVKNWFINAPNYQFEFSPTTNRANLANNLVMNIYPNPSNGLFQISLDLKGTSNVELQILDVLGKQVYFTTETAVNAFTKDINISHLPAGVYVVKAKTNQGIQEMKIIKQ